MTKYRLERIGGTNEIPTYVSDMSNGQQSFTSNNIKNSILLTEEELIYSIGPYGLTFKEYGEKFKVFAVELEGTEINMNFTFENKKGIL